MSWTTIGLLAAGAYLFKALGFLVLGPLSLRGQIEGEESQQAVAGRAGLAIRVGQLLPAALLAALVVSQTVTSGTDLVVDARLAGVTAGAVAVWRRAPFWLVLVIAAATTALIRLVS